MTLGTPAWSTPVPRTLGRHRSAPCAPGADGPAPESVPGCPTGGRARTGWAVRDGGLAAGRPGPGRAGLGLACTTVEAAVRRVLGRTRRGPSIYEHVRRHVPPDGSLGLLPGGERLPDQDELEGEVRWIPGARDGVATTTSASATAPSRPTRPSTASSSCSPARSPPAPATSGCTGSSPPSRRLACSARWNAPGQGARGLPWRRRLPYCLSHPESSNSTDAARRDRGGTEGTQVVTTVSAFSASSLTHHDKSVASLIITR